MADKNTPRTFNDADFSDDPSTLKPVKASAVRKLGDLALGFGQGAVGATKALSDAFGANNSFSQGLEGANQALDSGISAETKDRRFEADRIQQEAKGKGIAAEVAGFGRAFATDPIQQTAQGLGSVVPFLAAQFIPGAGQGATAARVAQIGMGLGMGAGTAKGAIHEEVQKRELAAGKTAEQAQAAADAAQAYGGANTDQIALGAGLGLADAVTGATPAAVRLLRQKLGKEVLEETGKKAGEGIFKAGAKGALAEMPVEFAQGGQEQLAANIAAQRAGYQADTWEGVVGKGGLEALASAGPGAAFGIAGRNHGAGPQPQPDPNAPQADGRPSVAPQGGVAFDSNVPPTLDARALEAAGVSMPPPAAVLDSGRIDRMVDLGTAQPSDADLIQQQDGGSGLISRTFDPRAGVAPPLSLVPNTPASDSIPYQQPEQKPFGQNFTMPDGSPPQQAFDDVQPLSKRMGLDSAVGPLSAAAVTAVDSGASPAAAALASGVGGGFGIGRARGEPVDVTPINQSAGQIGATKRLGETPIIDVEARWKDEGPRQGDMMAPNNAPFQSQALALQASQQTPQGGEVVAVPNGFVVRPQLLGIEQPTQAPRLGYVAERKDASTQLAERQPPAQAPQQPPIGQKYQSEPVRTPENRQNTVQPSAEPPRLGMTPAQQRTPRQQPPVRDGSTPIAMGMEGAGQTAAQSNKNIAPTDGNKSVTPQKDVVNQAAGAFAQALAGGKSQDDAAKAAADVVISNTGGVGAFASTKEAGKAVRAAVKQGLAQDTQRIATAPLSDDGMSDDALAKALGIDDGGNMGGAGQKTVAPEDLYKAAGAVLGTPKPQGGERAPVAKATTEAPARPANWRTNMISAAKVAKGVGISAKGKKLVDLVADIDAADAASVTDGTPWSDVEEKRLMSLIGHNGSISYKEMDGNVVAKLIETDKDNKYASATGKTKLSARRALLKKLSESKKPPQETEASAPPSTQADNIDPLLNKLASGYGYSGGIDTMPAGLGTTARKLHKAIIDGDVAMVQKILHPDNKRSREAFEKLFDGRVQLPSTVRDTNTVIQDFVGKVSAALAENVSATKSDEIGYWWAVGGNGGNGGPADSLTEVGRTAALKAVGISDKKIDNLKKRSWIYLPDDVRAKLEALRLSGWKADARPSIEKPSPSTKDLMDAAQRNGKLVVANVGDKPAAKTSSTVDFIKALEEAKKELPAGYSISPQIGSLSLMQNGKYAINGLSRTADGVREAVRLAKLREAEAKTKKDEAIKNEQPKLLPDDGILDDELKDALGKLGDVLGDVFGAKLNATGQQYTAGDLLPALSKVVELLVKKGFKSFSQSTGKAAQLMRADPRTAAHVDSISPRQWKAAYNAIAEGFEGTDSEDTINAMKADEVLAIVAPQTAQKPKVGTTAPAKTLAESLYQAIRANQMPKDNPALKKLVESFDGKPADQARMKQAQEELETAIAMTARDLVAKNEGDRSTFGMLLRLYESQPNLNIRTSTSVANQAYSTPAPLAFLASRLAGVTKATSVHEPTAGTGMLLIGADPKKAIVNELNDLRIDALKLQGFSPTQKDAATQLLVANGVKPDSVVTNPPFGSIKDADGKPVKVKVDGYSLGQIDHLIAARALDAMKEDGRATLIIGANKVDGGLSTDDRIFFNWLYSHYNVTGHFEVEGDLYSRQGAGWPVRVISINGRQKSNNFSPVAGTIQRVDNWSDVYEQFTKIIESEKHKGNIRATADGWGKQSSGAVESPNRTGQGQPTGGQGGAGGIIGTSPRDALNRPESTPISVGSGSDEQRLNAQSSVPRPQYGQNPAGAAKPAKPAGVSALSESQGNEFQAPYTPRSARKDEGVLIPANMAQPTQDALSRLEDAVGDIDEFAREELGYATVDDLHGALMGLQVDSVAMSIYQIKQGKAVVIADQTGIGKGRQAASIIRWAARHGMTPVFMSVKPSLFTDMYGDLADIGTDDITPFIMNGDAWVAGEGGAKLFSNRPNTHKRTIQGVADSGQLPNGSNALFLTYSQINVANVQRQALMALAPNAVFVLDESHNAAGASSTGEFVIGALEAAKGVVYLSATYAKRPDNMPLYFKTDIGLAAADTEGLAQAMAAGGLPLQTVVSNNLVKAGQMFRRERSYDGVSIASVFDSANRSLHERMSNATTKALRAIVQADSAFHEIYVKQLADQLAESGATVIDSAGNQIQKTVQHTEFSSVVHNFVKQMLLGLKAQSAADEAIASLKRGEKPIIAVENTMGSFLKEYAEANRIGQGDSLGTFDYRTVLSRALARSRVVIEVAANGDKIKRPAELGELDFLTRSHYKSAQEVIDSLTLNIPVSPIDWMRAEIERAGYTVAEITGRDLSVDYSNPDNPILSAIDSTEQKDKVNTTRQFNGGKLDALILNVAGSTGISLHASEKFEDQRQRHMIVAQAAGDINIFMQMLGRIHRTGQVRLPKYTILSVDLPTEKRPTAVLSTKMKSLNANTSSNTESATSVKTVDILNKYGDQIVAQYLRDNIQLAKALGMEEDADSEEGAREDIARRATGRLALQPIATQHAFYDEVEAQYNALIEYLNKTNQNDLEPRTFDFDAKEIRQEVLFEGPNKETPFGEDAIYGEYSIKAQGTPMKPDEIRAAMSENLNGATPEAHTQKLMGDLEAKFLAFYSTLEDAGKAVASGVREATRAFLMSHGIGSKFRIEINGESFNAVVLNVRNTHKDTGNPYSLSKLQVSVAVNGALRSLSVPATQFSKIEVASIAPVYQIDVLFKEQPPNQRETAKIITGNITAAYGELEGVRGTIVNFTKQDGTIEQGILLPKAFDYSKNTRGDYRLQDGAAALKFLQKSEDKDIGRFGIMTRDGVVRVLPSGQGIRVQVPKTKLKGGKYFLDKSLIEVAGDFVTQGQSMVATVYEPADATKMLDLLMKKQALYALPSMAEEAKALTGDKNQQNPDNTLKMSRGGAAPKITPERAEKLRAIEAAKENAERLNAEYESAKQKYERIVSDAKALHEKSFAEEMDAYTNHKAKWVGEKMERRVKDKATALARRRGGDFQDYMDEAREDLEYSDANLSYPPEKEFQRQYDRNYVVPEKTPRVRAQDEIDAEAAMSKAHQAKQEAAAQASRMASELREQDEKAEIKKNYRTYKPAPSVVHIDEIPEEKAGFTRLFHAGSDPDEKSYFSYVPEDARLGGFFALLGEWGAYGTGARYYADVRDDKILTHRDLLNMSERKVMAALHEIFNFNRKDEGIVWTAVVEDRENLITNDDDMIRVFGDTHAEFGNDRGSANWAAQRIRALLAKELGYQAVDMYDENGTSTVILSGVPLTRVLGRSETDKRGILKSGQGQTAAPQPAIPRTPKAAIKAALDRAYGRLFGRLEAKGLVTLTQTEQEAIEAAARARADKLGRDYQDELDGLMEAVSASRAWHGSPSRDITQFTPEKTTRTVFGWGVYFGDKIEGAEEYAPRASSSDKINPVKVDGKRVTRAESSAASDIIKAAKTPEQRMTNEYAEAFFKLQTTLVTQKNNFKEGFEQSVNDQRALDEKLSSSGVKDYGPRRLSRDEWKFLQDWYEKNQSRFGWSKQQAPKITGQVYEVEIPDESEMLLWDGTLSEQPKKILAALKKMGLVTNATPPTTTGKQIYTSLAEKIQANDKNVHAKRQASLELLAHGIKGNFSKKAGVYAVFDGADTQIVDVKYSANGLIQGFFDPVTKQAFMVADAMTEDTAGGVLMHEVGVHMAASGGKLAPLVNRAAFMVKSGKGAFFDDVRQKMARAGETSPEEAAAYLVEAYENSRGSAPSAVKQWLKDFMAAVRAWLFKAGGGLILSANQLTAADIAAVARANARGFARGGGGGGMKLGQSVKRSFAGEGALTAGKNGMPSASVPQQKLQLDDYGMPVINGAEVALQYGSPTDRMEFIPEGDWQQMVRLRISTPSNPFAGTIDALFEHGEPVALYDIEVEKSERGKKTASKAVKALLDATQNGSLHISNIVTEAQEFWATLGIPTQPNLERGRAYDGTITQKSYLSSSAAKNARAAGRVGANNGTGQSQAQGRPAEGGIETQELSWEELEAQGIRFSRTGGNGQPPTGAVPNYFDVKGTASQAKEGMADRLADWRGLSMQALGRRQIVDLWGKLLPQLGRYDDLVQKMDAEKNSTAAGADELTTAWATLDGKGFLGLGKAKNAGMEAKLAELMHDATLGGVDADPSVPLPSDATIPQKMAKGAFAKRFDALTPDAQSVYRKVRDIYADQNKAIRKALTERIERAAELSPDSKRTMIAQMDAEMLWEKQGVYFPLTRFGKYVVVVKDASGKTVSVSRAETLPESKKLRAEIQSRYPSDQGFRVSKVYREAEFNAARDAVGKGFMGDLVQALRNEGMEDSVIDSVGQLYLKSLPDLSWAKHGIHRKGTPGFSQDARRAFAQNMIHGASHLAKLRYADKLQMELADMQAHIKANQDDDGFDNVKAVQVYDEMVKRHDLLMSPKTHPLSTALTSAGFLFYLGLSPASAAVNLSQTALLAYPIMGAKWGYDKAGAALLKASAEVTKAKNDYRSVLQGDELRALTQAIDDGTIDVTMAHDLAGIANGEDQRVAWAMRPVMRAASFMFHHAEKFNRQVTFIAAYRLARENPKTTHEQAFADARKATYDGHFDYASSNRPRVMQGNWAKVLLLFKQYGQNMIYTLARQTYLSIKGETPEQKREARKAISGILALHASAAGVLGLPVVGTLLALASAMGGDDDEPWDAKVAIQNALAESLGQKPAEVLAHGLSRLTPWDMSGRVALNSLILPDVQEGLEGQRLAESAMTAALGPVAGIGTGFAKGVQKMSQGDYARGFEDMLPVSLRNPLKAMRYASEGNVDKSGVVINDEVSAAGVAGQALGFSPSETRLATEGKRAINQADKRLDERRAQLVRLYAMAKMADDDEGVTESREAIARFNAKNPDRKITVIQLAQSVKSRQKRIAEAQQGVYLPEKRRGALEAGRFAVTAEE